MKRKALFIGGTGTISTAISELVASDPNWELYVLNRGTRNSVLPENVKVIKADINDEREAEAALDGMKFDTVCDFIGFVKPQLERDMRLFNGRTDQFIYISSASAYQKPVTNYKITESTPLNNPYWEYSRNKIECEEYLMKLYREIGFPVTIVRPSHTYDDRSIPVGIHGNGGSWQVISRMIEGKPVIVHGDGTSLWTLTYNRDFAKAFKGLMGNVHAIGETYHITSDESLTWNEIYSIIADALGVEYMPYYVPSQFLASLGKYDLRGALLGDKANTVVFDNSKVKSAVPGFVAETRFDTGVRYALDYIMSHPECRVPDPEFDEWCDKIISAMEKAKEELKK